MDRVVRRALAASAVIALLAAGTAAADTLRADSDVLTAGLQSGRVLGDVVVGSKVEVPVRFELSCSGSAHLDPGQQLTLSLSSATWPGDGSSSFVPVTLGPVPSGWPADGASCPSASPMAVQGTVALTAPSTPSGPLTVTIVFGQSIAPAGAGDKSAVTGIAAVDLTMTFVPNTPPLLSLPADMTVEGNAAGGATVGYAATASDTEDDPDPSAVCTPAAGSLFPLGSSTVDCTATDTAGARANGSFVVTVVDTTPPTLAGVPADVSAVAADAAGATVTYAPPTASDAVDPAPVVACSPATGSLFPVGVTTVGCTATDATGNTASASFSVTVTAPVTPPPPPSPGASVVFDPPIGPDGSVRVNGQRVLPVKARVILAAGAPRFGAATLMARPCEGMFVAGAALRVPMSWQQGAERWIGLLPTDRFPAGCFEVALELADSEAAGEAASSAAPTTLVGGFTLWVSPPSAKAPKAR